MRISKPASLFAATLAAFALAAPSASAQSVQPVILDLQPAGREASQTLTVTNTRATAIPVELRVESMVFDAEGARGTGEDPGDLLVFPAQAIIEPGQAQVFRVQYVGDAALERSRHYYVTVAQLPVELPQDDAGIQLLYNIQVIASVLPQGGNPDLTITGATVGRNMDGEPVPVVTVTNHAPTHGYLSRGQLTVVQRDASGKELIRQTLTGPDIQQGTGYGLVAGQDTRAFTLPMVLPAEIDRIEAQFEPISRR